MPFPTDPRAVEVITAAVSVCSSQDYLYDTRSAKPAHISVVHKDFDRWAKRAKLGKKVRPHSLRRTCASVAATKVMPAQLKAFMRHANIDTTMRYYTNVGMDAVASIL